MLGLALAKANNSSGSGCFLGFSPNQFQFYPVNYLFFFSVTLLNTIQHTARHVPAQEAEQISAHKKTAGAMLLAFQKD